MRGVTTQRIFKNTVYLSIGTIGSKALGLLIFIYVARVLGPTNYGDFKTAIGFVSLFSIISIFGLDMYGLREGAKNVHQLGTIQNEILPLRLRLSLIAIFVAVIIALVVPYSNEIKVYILLLSSLLIIGGGIPAGLTNHFDTTFRIVEKMKFISAAQILRMIIFGGLILSLYFIHPNVLATVTAVILSSIIALSMRYHWSSRFVENKFSFRINKDKAFQTLKTAYWFGMATLLARIYSRIDVQMIYLMAGSDEVGYYSAAWQIVDGGNLFLISLSVAIFPTSARNILKPDYSKKLLKIIAIFSIISIIISIITLLISSQAIEFLYGSEYRQSALILSILIWTIPIRFFMIWGNQVLECTNALKLRIKGLIFPMMLNIGLNAYMIPLYGAGGAAVASIASILLSTMILTFLGFKALKRCSNTPSEDVW